MNRVIMVLYLMRMEATYLMGGGDLYLLLMLLA